MHQPQVGMRYNREALSVWGPDRRNYPAVIVPVSHFANAGAARLNRPAGRILTDPLTTPPGGTERVTLLNTTITETEFLLAVVEQPEGCSPDPAVPSGWMDLTECQTSDGKAVFTLTNTGDLPMPGRPCIIVFATGLPWPYDRSSDD